jgi:hypothetical protein
MFEWKTKCEEKINLFKELHTIAPILNIVNPNEHFVVCTDPCKEGIEGVLTQNRHAISYEWKNIKEHERNYETHDLKIFSKIHALNMWRNYLVMKRSKFMT